MKQAKNTLSNNILENKKSIVLYIFLSLFAFGQLFPLIWLIDFSFGKSGDLFGKYILKWPSPPQFENYISAWIYGNVPRYLANSLIVTGATIFLTVILSLTLGYAFTRMQWKLRGLFLTIIMLGIMIPIYATLLQNFLVFTKLKLINSYFGLILPYTAFSLAQGVFVMSAFLKSIPKSLEEAAIIDGCGIYRIIFLIIAPLTKPALITISTMTFFSSWNEFIMVATFINSTSLRTLPFSYFSFTGQYSSNYAAQFAALVLTAIPSILIYIIFNEQFTKGATMGSIKG